jgi:hypothetical protein
MKLDISNTINDWAVAVDVINLKPLEDQTNWNELMKEFNGDPEYDTIVGIPCEMYGHPDMGTEGNVAGTKYAGKRKIHMPMDEYSAIKDGSCVVYQLKLPEWVYNKIDVEVGTLINISDDTILSADDGLWRMDSIQFLMGEAVITIILKVGE